MKKLLGCFFIFIFYLINFAYAQEKIIIGLLSTNIPVYKNETSDIKRFNTFAEKLGIQLKVIDYNLIYSRYLLEDEKLDIEEMLKEELHENGITKVIIPGNWYNIDSDPHPPLPNRQVLTEALVKLSKKGISVLGICGGMQGILHAEGIKIKNMKNIGFNKDHLISFDTPYSSVGKMNKVVIDPKSNFAKIIQNNKIQKNDDGWLILNLPDYHEETIDLEQSNLDLLKAKGYKIIGFSEDGIIEIIEDENGNVHFQMHPEIIIVNSDAKKENNDSDEGSVTGIWQFFSDFITS